MMSACMIRAWEPSSLWLLASTLLPGNETNATPIRTIVVIEDNVDAADTLRDLLEVWGHLVTVAYTGPAGVAAVCRIRPQIVLCDLGLPGCDGFAVARQIRQDPRVAGVRLYAVTGYGSPADRARSQAAGFDLHLTKPLNPETLERLLLSG